MSDEADAIEQFGQLTDVLLKTLKVPETAINYVDSVINYEQGRAEHQSPLVTALEFGVAGLISAAVVSTIGVEALGAGVIAIAGEEAAVGAAALVDSTIAGSFPGLALAGTGSDVIATVSQAIGTTAVGVSVSKIVAEGFKDWAYDVFHPSSLNITKSDDSAIEVSQGGNEVVLSNSRNVTVDQGANAYIIGDSYNALLQPDSVTTQVALGGNPKSYFENSDGSSEVLSSGKNGSEILDYYSGGAGTGNLFARDVERANGTSVLTNFDSSGNPTTFTYSGPEGTGNVIGNGDQSGGDGGSESSDTVTFQYQGNPFTSTTDSQTGLSSQGIYNGVLSATVVVDDLPQDYTGRVSEGQSSAPYFVYTSAGTGSHIDVNGMSAGIEANSYIDFVNGTVVDWDLLGDISTNVGTNVHVESGNGFGSYSGDYASETSISSASYLKTGVTHNLGSWTSS